MLVNPPEGVHFLKMSPDKLMQIWSMLQSSHGLFDDYTQGKIDVLIAALSRKDSLWLELDGDLGLLYATEIVPSLSASVHIAFWDHKVKERIPLVLACLAWLVNICELEKVNASLPDFAKVARKHVQGLGFREEGVIRRYSRSQGRLYDQHLYGILKEEILTDERLRS